MLPGEAQPWMEYAHLWTNSNRRQWQQEHVGACEAHQLDRLQHWQLCVSNALCHCRSKD